jgi:very-short-patch-repair endonuclease
MPHAVVSERQRSRAKHLRKAMTRAETLLWRHLKANRIDGLGFRRQVPIRNYIVDFVCLSAKFIIELDGESHDFEAQQKADQSRDAFFVSEGFQVPRFTNEQVLSNLEGVVEIIRQTATLHKNGLPPSPTLPHKGGGSHRTRRLGGARSEKSLLVSKQDRELGSSQQADPATLPAQTESALR